MVRALTITEVLCGAHSASLGEICHLQVLGKHVVYLNSANAAFELLDRRGSIYSSKPRLVMLGEM